MSSTEFLEKVWICPALKCYQSSDEGLVLNSRSFVFFIVMNMANKAKCKVIATIDDVHGICPVYKGGEKIVMQDGILNLEETDAVCLQLLSTLIHEYMVKQHQDYWKTEGGFDYSKEKTKCPRGGPPYGEGYVIVSTESIPQEL